mmetsp:Transcript_7357/g.18891  ORF Transcript_7357/g.18891 Transcript_7357/m.18891 type:complete len:208 (-) Transcript_7357:1012-1635(-)
MDLGEVCRHGEDVLVGGVDGGVNVCPARDKVLHHRQEASPRSQQHGGVPNIVRLFKIRAEAQQELDHFELAAVGRRDQRGETGRISFRHGPVRVQDPPRNVGVSAVAREEQRGVALFGAGVERAAELDQPLDELEVPPARRQDQRRVPGRRGHVERAPVRQQELHHLAVPPVARRQHKVESVVVVVVEVTAVIEQPQQKVAVPTKRR